MKPKVTVIGAGAVGSMFGGLIKHNAPNIDVQLIGRGAHNEAMRKQGGVTIQGDWGEIHVPLNVSESMDQVANSDFVLLTVKSYSTAEAMQQAVNYIDSNTTLISIQNGINQPVLRQYVSPDRLVMGMTATKIETKRPGTVSMTRNDVTVIGPSENTMPADRIRAAAELLRLSKLKIKVDPGITGAQYNKLIFNTLGAAASLSNADFLKDAVLHSRWRNTVAIPVQHESLQVVLDSGIPISRIPGAPDVYRFGRLLRLLNTPLVGSVLSGVVKRLNRQPIRFSLAADLEHGKQTEVDFINGAIVRLAENRQSAAPLNKKIVELVHKLEQSGGFFSRDEVISIFRNLQQ